MDAAAQAGDVHARNADLRRKAVISLGVVTHPACEVGHDQNVRLSYSASQGHCTMSDWRACAVSGQDAAMATPSPQADLIRQWREHKGLSLETVAFGVELLCKTRGVPSKSRKYPRTHASLSRWETGQSDVKEVGLAVIAEAMGITIEQIRQPPPVVNAPPQQQVTVPAEDAALVEAYAEGLRQKRGG